MSITAGRVFNGLSRAASSRRIFTLNASTVRLNSVRSLTLTSQRSARPDEEQEVKNEPIKFSTSKASHRTWKVHRSMGSQHKRPLWKVIPFSLLATTFLLWCVLREETDIDKKLEKQLYEQLPGLLSDEEDENKTT
uniref:ubiquinol-cytochrome c reductase complex assembly factor 4 isoform X2 n=1 Tax=Semicossyphus pulcher TaxID=241346 RepID=UPI0037E73F6C